MRLMWVIILTASLLFGSSLELSAETTYAVILLDSLPGMVWSRAYEINNDGSAVGYCRDLSTPEQGEYACYWKTGQVQPVGSLPEYPFSRAYDINANGQIVGYAYQSSSVRCGSAFIWTPEVGILDLGFNVGYSYSEAWHINDTGQVAGFAYDISSSTVAVRWDALGNPTILKSLAGDSGSLAVAINSNGLVAGTSFSSINTSQAVLWDQSGYGRVLGQGEASGINDSGQVIGFYDEHALLWNPNGGVVDLAKGRSSRAYGISNDGRIVGTVGSRAYLWNPDGTEFDLSSLVAGIHSEAWSINDNGEVVGAVWDTQGNLHAVMWTLVPEQSSLCVVIIALGSFICYAKRWSIIAPVARHKMLKS